GGTAVPWSPSLSKRLNERKVSGEDRAVPLFVRPPAQRAPGDHRHGLPAVRLAGRRGHAQPPEGRAPLLPGRAPGDDRGVDRPPGQRAHRGSVLPRGRPGQGCRRRRHREGPAGHHGLRERAPDGSGEAPYLRDRHAVHPLRVGALLRGLPPGARHRPLRRRRPGLLDGAPARGQAPGGEVRRMSFFETGDQPDAETLLRRVSEIINNTRSLPLSSSVKLDNKEEVLELLGEALDRLPEELRQARWLLKERNEFLAKNQRDADEILEAARVRAERMVQRTEIVREAQHTAKR